MKSYVTPEVLEIADYHEATNGLWFGNWRDLFGGKAFIAIGW